jgi:hypothetical protein
MHISEVWVENNTFIDQKEVENLAKKLKSAKKPSITLLRLCILVSALVAILVAINMHTNSVFCSSMRFVFVFLVTTAFIIIFNYAINKTSIMSGLYVLNGLMDFMSKNEWSYSFPRKNIHPLILLHPVFRTIAGLYIFKVGHEDEGLTMIEKAASELPEINNAISHGEITSVPRFKDLSMIIASDLMPNTSILALFRIIQALGSFLAIIIVLVLAFATSWHFITVK